MVSNTFHRPRTPVNPLTLQSPIHLLAEIQQSVLFNADTASVLPENAKLAEIRKTIDLELTGDLLSDLDDTTAVVDDAAILTPVPLHARSTPLSSSHFDRRPAGLCHTDLDDSSRIILSPLPKERGSPEKYRIYRITPVSTIRTMTSITTPHQTLLWRRSSALTMTVCHTTLISPIQSRANLMSLLTR